MPDFLVGLNIKQLETVLMNSLFSDWYIEDFQQNQYLILSRKRFENDEKESKYIISVQNGKVAIYSAENDNKLLQVTEIKIDRLPKSEKETLKKGIYVDSDEELFTILEGFISYYQD